MNRPKFILLFFKLVLTVVTSLTINCGGPKIPGEAIADNVKYHIGDRVVHRYANGDFMESLWYTYAFAPYGHDLVYRVQVPRESYVKVTAMFAELWSGALYKHRILNVTIAGVRSESNLNVLKTAGGLHKHHSVYREYFSSTGIVEVRVSAVIGVAMLNGLKVTTAAIPQVNSYQTHAIPKSGMKKMVIPFNKIADADDDTDTEESSQSKSKGKNATKKKKPKKSISKKPVKNVQPLPKKPTTGSPTFAKDKLFLNCGGPKIGTIMADTAEYRSQTQGYVGSFKLKGADKSELLSQSFSSKGQDLVYTFTVPPNTGVKVRAIFAEIYSSAAKKGGRVLNVYINRVLVANTLDVWSKAGGLKKSMHAERSFVVKQGVVEVRVEGVVQNAMINAIHLYAKGVVIRAGGKFEVMKITPPPNPTKSIKTKPKPPAMTNTRPRTIQINCGGPALKGILQDDPKYYSTSPKGVGNFVVKPNSSPYHSNTYGKNRGDVVYRFPVIPGSRVRVVAGFAEIWRRASKAGTRVMNVYVNGVRIAENLDVATASGGIGVEYDVQREFITKSKFVTVLVSSVKQNAFLSTVKLTVWEPVMKERKIAAKPKKPKKVEPIAIPIKKSPANPKNPKEIVPIIIPIQSPEEKKVPTKPKKPKKDIPIAIPIPNPQKKNTAPSSGPRIIQVNCGGPALKGILQDNPKYYSTSPKGVGNFVVSPNTSPYHSNTYGKYRGDLIYRFPVVPGSRVRVVTGFAEIWRRALKPGARIMNVSVNGVFIAENLNVAVAAGGLGIEYDLQREFITNAEFVTIVVSSVKQNAFMSTVKLTVWEPKTSSLNNNSKQREEEQSISIPFPGSTKKNVVKKQPNSKKPENTIALPIPRVLQVNCGGPKLDGIEKDDPKFYSKSPTGIGNLWVFPNTSPYHSNAYGKKRGDVVYRFPIVPGSRVRVIAGFAEIWEGALNPGTRVMNVKVNGFTIAKNLDVATAAGGLGIEYDVQREFIATGNHVSVVVSSVRQNAFLSTVKLIIWDQHLVESAAKLQTKKGDKSELKKQPTLLTAIPIPKPKALSHTNLKEVFI